MLCRAYVGVAYGKFDPSTPTFSYLLPVSVAVSLLGAGSTAFGMEGAFRNADRPGTVSTVSRYGIVALLLRTAQVAALVFWIALLSCAEKGWAGIAIVLSVVVVLAMGGEAAFRSVHNGRSGFNSSLPAFMRSMDAGSGSWPALGLCVAHLGLVGGMAAVFFGDEQAEGWAGAAVLLGGMLVGCGVCLFAGCKLFTESEERMEKYPSVRDRQKREKRNGRYLSLCCALVCVPLLLAGTIYAFVTAEHVDNNYANKSMPIGGPGSGSGPDDPQYFDCHERTSGLYPAYLATALCVVLTPLYAALDPEYGMQRSRKKTWK